MMKKVIYIEGTTDKDNGDLRKAFNLLLIKELGKSMPRIVMGDGKTQTIDKFQTRPLEQNESRFLLIDSDKPISDKQAELDYFNAKRPDNQRKVDATTSNTFFMIQEAETWIMSQPNILHSRKVNTSFLPKGNMMKVDNPSDVLAEVYRKSGKEYHKVKEFVKLFPLLNTAILKQQFPEFQLLVDALK